MSDGPGAPVDAAADLLAAPVPGAPYTGRSRAHVQLGQALRAVAEYAERMVPVGPRPWPAYGGSLVADALALREMVEHVVVAAVLTEREDGTSWKELGCAAGTDEASVRERWEDDERSWRVELDESPAGRRADDVAAVGAAAADLDAWIRDRLDRDELPGGLRPDGLLPGERLGAAVGPVTATLERMDALGELWHWYGHARALAASGTTSAPDGGPGGGPAAGPGGATGGGAELAGIYERIAVVYDALAADPQLGEPEHRLQAAAHRRRAAALRDTADRRAGPAAPP